MAVVLAWHGDGGRDSLESLLLALKVQAQLEQGWLTPIVHFSDPLSLSALGGVEHWEGWRIRRGALVSFLFFSLFLLRALGGVEHWEGWTIGGSGASGGVEHWEGRERWYGGSRHELEVFIEHIPRAEHLQARQDACSAATTNVTSLPMRIEQGGYRVYCVHVLWPYPRCGSDRLPHIIL